MATRFNDFSGAGSSIDALFEKEVRVENDGSGNPIYIGYAKGGSATSASVWLIKKFTYDGNSAVTRSQIANNNLTFSHIWDDRASLF
jgi:hypothetical protein